MTTTALTIAEILDLPAVVPLWPTVGKALSLAESTTYQLAAENKLPFEVIRLGRRRVARTVDLHRFLGLLPQDVGAVREVEPRTSAGNDGAPGVEPGAPVGQVSKSAASR
jgi:hypothetical protein